MIPRTKVNYSFSQLFQALITSDADDVYRRSLVQRLQAYAETPNVLLTPSGRGGLYYLLKVIDKPRVIVPAYTCKAVPEACMLAGKEVVYAEVDEDGFNMSPSVLEPLLDDSSIVIATHQFGIPCDIKEMAKMCRKSGAFLIEDVAAALGTRTGGKLVGSFGDAAFYSFDSTKLINVPMKGGFVTVQDPALFAHLREAYLLEIRPMPHRHKFTLILSAIALLMIENPVLYRLFHEIYFVLRGKFTTDSTGLNVHLTEFYRYDFSEWQARIALPQWVCLDAIIAARQSIYAALRKGLADCKAFSLPPEDIRLEWACIRFPIRLRDDKIAYYRRAARLGIDFAFSFTYIACPEEFLKAHKVAETVLDIPFYLKLSDREIDRIISVIRSLDACVSMP